MKRSNFKIAITSVGGGVGQSILKALKSANYSTIALDSDPLATGLYASNISYIVPHSKEKGYISKLIEICNKEHCTLLFPGSDTELLILAKHKSLFKKNGITVVVSSPEVIKLANDKLQTFTELSKAGFCVPKTQTFEDFSHLSKQRFPVVFKPMLGGSRSANVKVINDKVELQLFQQAKQFDGSNTVVQEYIDSEEYTCGSVTLDGTCFGVIVMRRVLRDGDTYKCFSIRSKKIESFVKRLVEHIQPYGACNIQLRLKNGEPHVFEVNARCSGTTAARALAGFNEPVAIADYILLEKTPKFSVKEVSILRYWKELVVENKTILSLTKTKSFHNNTVKKL